MNTPANDDPDDLRYAEYALGLLEDAARAQVERELAHDPEAAAEVERWQHYLAPLAADIPADTPPTRVWSRIEAQLGPAPSPRPVKRRRDDPRWWRRVALGAGLAAAACIVALIILIVPSHRRAAPTTVYMTSVITRTGGQAAWTATVDLARRRMVVVAATPAQIPAGRAPELWLIPAGGKPIPAGMIASSGSTTIDLDSALAARIHGNATLAVSLEPPGGSPTGQPTGPVVAKGSITRASDHQSGKPSAWLGPSGPPVAP